MPNAKFLPVPSIWGHFAGGPGTNPDDVKQDHGTMSLLAPWLAVMRRGALVLTNQVGDNVVDAVNRLRPSALSRIAGLTMQAAQPRLIIGAGGEDPANCGLCHCALQYRR